MMTLKDLRKVNIATNTFFTIDKLNGETEYIIYNYCDEDDERFSRSLRRLKQLEKEKVRVKYITNNSKGNFLSVTLEEYEPRKKRS